MVTVVGISTATIAVKAEDPDGNAGSNPFQATVISSGRSTTYGIPLAPSRWSRRSGASGGAQKRTSASPTPRARLYRMGHGEKAVLGYMGHLLTENRHGRWWTWS